MSENKPNGQEPEAGNPNEGEASVEELKKQISTLSEEKNNLVGELKDDRTKRQELADKIATLEEALEDATKKNTKEGAGNDVADVVKNTIAEVMAKEKESTAKQNKQLAIEKFVSENNEFAESNDPTGKKREALMGAMTRFNQEGLVTVDQFYLLIKDAYRLLDANTTSQPSSESAANPYSSTPRSSIAPSVTKENKLNDNEQRLIKNNGWTEDRYLKLKEKNPAYIERLLTYVNQSQL